MYKLLEEVFFQQPTVITSVALLYPVSLVDNTSTTEIVTLDVTNQTKSGQKPDDTLNEDGFFSVGFAFEKHSSPVLFLTNPPV